MRTLRRLIAALSGLYAAIGLRFYGWFFAVFGILFLYWGGRGLIAYSNGVRAAWAEPGLCLLGIAAGPFITWFGWRMIRDVRRIHTPAFSQTLLLILSVSALVGGVVAIELMGTSGLQFAMMAAVVGAAGVYRWWSRRGGRGEAQDAKATFFDTIAELEEKDPAQAQQLMGRYFEAEAESDAKRREELWKRAPSDQGAAQQLLRLLQQDLKGTRHALQEWARAGDLTPHEQTALHGTLEEIEADIVRVTSYLHGSR